MPDTSILVLCVNFWLTLFTLIQDVAQPSSKWEITVCQGRIGISFRKENMTIGITQKTVLMKYPIVAKVPTILRKNLLTYINP